MWLSKLSMSTSRNLRSATVGFSTCEALPERSDITPMTKGSSTFFRVVGIFVGDVNARRAIAANESLSAVSGHGEPSSDISGVRNISRE